VWTAPPGWVRKAQNLTTSGNNMLTALFVRKLQAGDGASVLFSHNGSGGNKGIVLALVRGDQVAEVDVGFNSGVNDPDKEAPAIQTKGLILIFQALSATNSGITHVAPTGYTLGASVTKGTDLTTCFAHKNVVGLDTPGLWLHTGANAGSEVHGYSITLREVLSSSPLIPVGEADAASTFGVIPQESPGRSIILPQSANFNGTSDYYNAGDAWDFGFCFSAWVYLEALGADRSILEKTSGGFNTAHDWSVGYDQSVGGTGDGEALFLFTQDDGPSVSRLYLKDISAGRWYHIAGARFDNSTFKLLVDGVHVPDGVGDGSSGSPGTYTSTTSDTNKELMIGAHNNHASNPSSFTFSRGWLGNLADVVLWDTDVPDAELIDIFKGRDPETVSRHSIKILARADKGTMQDILRNVDFVENGSGLPAIGLEPPFTLNEEGILIQSEAAAAQVEGVIEAEI